jgi:hypothetical protein
VREVNNLFHFTKELNTITEILKNGFKPSYAIEKFGSRNILVPMISFSNILLRDVGKNEVVDYGSYAIGFNREFATTIDINPVCYVYGNSIMEKAILDLYDLSTIPQTVDILKDITKVKNFTKVTDYIKLSPLVSEVENLINSINAETSDEMISAIKTYSEKIFENAYYQLLLAKPYKVVNKLGETKIAYNEREWRKGYKELGYIFETDKNGNKNLKFEELNSTPKPHFSEENYILKLDIESIKYIVVIEENEIKEIQNVLSEIYGEEKMSKIYSSKSIQIGTLENLKHIE